VAKYSITGMLAWLELLAQLNIDSGALYRSLKLRWTLYPFNRVKGF